jgi:hypothetical protein
LAAWPLRGATVDVFLGTATADLAVRVVFFLGMVLGVAGTLAACFS